MFLELVHNGGNKALKCCQNLYQVVVRPCPGAFFSDDPGLTLSRVKFVPDASVWATAYRSLSALVIPNLFYFSISSALR